jgi:hypothetical protein
MPNFKPSIRINNRNFTASYRTFNTHKELKRNLLQALQDSYDHEVSVSRSRRGNWGEWFETWELNNGNPRIIRQGWM